MENIFYNITFWILTSAFLFLVSMIFFISILFIGKTTHALIEIKAKFKKSPICIFFSDNKTAEWKAIKPEAGIIEDKDYGCFIINEKGCYSDKKTSHIILPFDTTAAIGVNMKAAALADTLQYVVTDDEQMKILRHGIATNKLDDARLDCLRTSIHISSIKNLLTAITPHNINAKINMTLAQKMKGYGNVNVMQLVLIFAAILGAVVISAILLKTFLK